MVGSQYSTNNYKSLKISIREMLTFVPGRLRTEKMCKNAVKKLPLVIRYIVDQYKTKEMCDKSIVENGGTLIFVPDCYKKQKNV